MWHEARRQEKKIRGLMVDYKKRAERRRQFYERIKQDPTQFVRVIGRHMPIHLEHSVALAAESPQSMMPWQGNPDITIDRFDVRAHLDYISDVCDSANPKLSKGDVSEERKCSYERYRILVQNECTAVSEEQCLQQIYNDELFGAVDAKKGNETEQKNLERLPGKKERDCVICTDRTHGIRKRSSYWCTGCAVGIHRECYHKMEHKIPRVRSDKKAAIGYTYEDSTPAPKKSETDLDNEEEEEEESSDEEVDLDIAFDVDDLTTEQSDQLNLCSADYGMKGNDYLESLHRDKEETECVRQVRLIEEEKAQFSGRKSRRERRAYKDKRMKERMLSPPCYAARDSPTYESYKKSSSSSSRSRSPSPVKTKMKFITSFGGDEEEEVVHGPCLPPPSHTSRHESKHKSSSHTPRKSLTTSRERSRWDDRNRGRGRFDRSGCLSRFGRRQSRSRSRSLSRTHNKRYSPARSKGRRSRSASRSRSRKRSVRSRSASSSNSRSPSPRTQSSPPQRQPSPPLKRYRMSSRSSSNDSSSSPKRASPPPVKRYRRPSLSSASVSSESDDGTKRSDASSNPISTHRTDDAKVMGKSRDLGPTNKAATLTPQERLRRRMQVQLNRQYKADKKAQREKEEKVFQQQQDREEVLKLRGIEMRRREREKRHRENEGDESTDEENWSGKNDEDNDKTSIDGKPLVDDKPTDHRTDKTADRQPRQLLDTLRQTDRQPRQLLDTPRQTDRHEARDGGDSRADRNAGRHDGNWQNDRYHWRGDGQQTRDAPPPPPEYRGDRFQGPPPDWRNDRHHPRGDFHWREDRHQARGAPHWQGDRRQFGCGGRGGDMHGSNYRRRSPSPRQYDQRSRPRSDAPDSSCRPLVDY